MPTIYGIRSDSNARPFCESRLPRPASPEGCWEDRHRLVNTSDDLRAWIREEMRRTGKSKTRIIVDTLEEVRKTSRSRGRHSRQPRPNR